MCCATAAPPRVKMAAIATATAIEAVAKMEWCASGARCAVKDVGESRGGNARRRGRGVSALGSAGSGDDDDDDSRGDDFD